MELNTSSCWKSWPGAEGDTRKHKQHRPANSPRRRPRPGRVSDDTLQKSRCQDWHSCNAAVARGARSAPVACESSRSRGRRKKPEPDCPSGVGCPRWLQISEEDFCDGCQICKYCTQGIHGCECCLVRHLHQGNCTCSKVSRRSLRGVLKDVAVQTEEVETAQVQKFTAAARRRWRRRMLQKVTVQSL